MDWTLTKIKARVRQISGRPDVSQLSEDELLDYINDFYQNSFPLLLETSELEAWYEKTLAQSVDEYALDEEYLTLDLPITINGAFVDFTQNRNHYYHLWPETQTWAEGQPFSVLFYDRKLIFRPPPDGATSYKFKAACTKRPTALADEGDKPPNQAWGPAIFYGTAEKILRDGGEENAAARVNGFLNMALIEIGRQMIRNLTNQRSIPRF